MFFSTKKRYPFYLVFKLSPVAVSLLYFLSPSSFAGLHFDPTMISAMPGAVADLSKFEKSGGQLPGNYEVEVYINGRYAFTETLPFRSVSNLQTDKSAGNRHEVNHDDTGLLPVFNQSEIVSLGVRKEALKKDLKENGNERYAISDLIPDAYTSLNFQAMRLDISIPQAALQAVAHGWIPPEQWNEGINAALLNYQFTGSENRGAYGNSSNHFLSLNSGLNIGAWRFRDDSTWSQFKNSYSQHSSWQHLRTYAQRSVIPLKSELTIGDSSTDSDIFEPLSYRGFGMATDDSMYPETMRGFAPVIKGIANTSAQITVRQNKNVIYRTSVASGAFEIKDLYPVSGGGDLEVTITEANGRIKTFIVPYSSVPVLQREGHLRYTFTVGRYRNNSARYSRPLFLQGTLLWGLPHNITAYGGYQLSENYKAVAVGTGFNMGAWGAISQDITQANSILPDGTHHQGQSLRFLYGRSLISTGTTFQLAGYRYSTSGFHTLDETALNHMSGWLTDDLAVDPAGKVVKQNWINYYNLYNNKRNQFQLNVNQRIGDKTSIYLTANHQTYWRSRNNTDSIQIGLSTTQNDIGYSLSYGYNKIREQPDADKTVFISVSVPLSKWLSHPENTVHKNTIWGSYSASRDSDGEIIHQAGVSGTALSDNNLDWSVSQGYSEHNRASGDLSAGYTGSYGNMSAGYGYASDYRQIRYGASGGAILHAQGLTIGQHLGSTNVLIAAPGAKNIKIENGSGVYTDWRGFAVLPYARIYSENRVALDISTLNDNTEISKPVVRLIPTRGAIVRADFITKNGAKRLIKIFFHGEPLPFGTTVSTGDSSGLVSESGEVYLSGLKENNLLEAKWGNSQDQQCSVHLIIPEKEMNKPLSRTKEICQ